MELFVLYGWGWGFGSWGGEDKIETFQNEEKISDISSVTSAALLMRILGNPANRALGGFMQNGGWGGGGGRGGESKIGPFQTEEEIAESAQRYCCGD